ncbi:Ig-like domain-containing protein [Lysinibacillus antri]|uniref:SbsA Ig-like domain-containing protein n=1 Tax=Lysinibacillus antri TaxID=2498145 RepID=A0A3S0P2V1_9BACI|nr:Ig-like domain-containing protein [Lysinibacillus antri]RUL49814.1 hypothetical protein EK386_14760 [Lysinibacillus antri]
MKKALIVLCSVLLFLLLPIDAPNAKTWRFQATEDVNKVWEINFNGKLDAKTVNSTNIYVKDGQSIHPTTTNVINSGRTIKVKPNTPYTVGKLYELIVTTNVKNVDGKVLKDSVKMQFKIVETDTIFKAVQSITSQNITILTIVTDSDVLDVKISSESLKYVGNNTYEYVLIGDKIGDKVTIYAYDEKNKLLEKMTYTIGE